MTDAASQGCLCVLHNAVLYPVITYPITALSVTIYRLHYLSIYLNGTWSLFITIFSCEHQHNFSRSEPPCSDSAEKIKTYHTPPSVHYKQQIVFPHGNLLVTLDTLGWHVFNMPFDRQVNSCLIRNSNFRSNTINLEFWFWRAAVICNISFLLWGSKWPLPTERNWNTHYLRFQNIKK